MARFFVFFACFDHLFEAFFRFLGVVVRRAIVVMMPRPMIGDVVGIAGYLHSGSFGCDPEVIADFSGDFNSTETHKGYNKNGKKSFKSHSLSI